MAPFGAQLLGDLGADVVKVETGAGDGSRVMGGGPHPELSGIALNLHRNKRSIGIDLKAPRGRDVLLRLLADADVLITNLRPGPLRRLGLDHESLRDELPAARVLPGAGLPDVVGGGRPAGLRRHHPGAHRASRSSTRWASGRCTSCPRPSPTRSPGCSSPRACSPPSSPAR